MDREDGANDSAWEFQREKTSPRCIHVSKAWSLAVGFHGQLNSYSAGKGSSDLTRCKRFSTDLQLFYASYSLCISLQHKGESCSFLENISYLQPSDIKIVSQGIISSLCVAITILLELPQSISKLESKEQQQRSKST